MCFHYPPCFRHAVALRNSGLFLTELERLELYDRRKSLYLDKYPHTKRGATGGKTTQDIKVISGLTPNPGVSSSTTSDIHSSSPVPPKRSQPIDLFAEPKPPPMSSSWSLPFAGIALMDFRCRSTKRSSSLSKCTVPVDMSMVLKGKRHSAQLVKNSETLFSFDLVEYP